MTARRRAPAGCFPPVSSDSLPGNPVAPRGSPSVGAARACGASSVLPLLFGRQRGQQRLPPDAFAQRISGRAQRRAQLADLLPGTERLLVVLELLVARRTAAWLSSSFCWLRASSLPARIVSWRTASLSSVVNVTRHLSLPVAWPAGRTSASVSAGVRPELLGEVRVSLRHGHAHLRTLRFAIVRVLQQFADADGEGSGRACGCGLGRRCRRHGGGDRRADCGRHRRQCRGGGRALPARRGWRAAARSRSCVTAILHLHRSTRARCAAAATGTPKR